MAIREIKVPELGEGIEEGDVVSILVSEGDRIEKEQSIVEVESEKAAVEIPSPFAGVVKEILVEEGARIRVGQAILRLETELEEAGDEETSVEGGHEEEQAEAPPDREAGPRRRRREEEQEPEEREEEEDAEEQDEQEKTEDVTESPPSARQEGTEKDVVPAGPGVRRLARELGLDLRDIEGSERGGRITAEDVKGTARRLISERPSRSDKGTKQGTSGSVRTGEQPPFPDLSKWGETSREPLGSLRRTATRTTRTSWRLIPHVTQFDHADITELDKQRQELAGSLREEGVKLTLTAIVVKAAALALRKFPRFNASLDEEAEEVVLRKYVHVGVAVDTERGLVVPVVRDADRKPLREVAADVAELAAKARGKRIKPEEMSGATFSVTNLGGLGTTYFTPIVNWPQVAVLGIGRAEVKPVFREGEFQARSVLPLVVSYDHRLIDGADAARFLRWIAASLEQPLRLLLED